MKDKEWEVENVATRYCDFLGIIKDMANSHAATSGDSGNVYFPTYWASIAFTIDTWQSHHIWRCWIFWIWKLEDMPKFFTKLYLFERSKS